MVFFLPNLAFVRVKQGIAVSQRSVVLVPAKRGVVLEVSASAGGSKIHREMKIQ